MSSSTLKNARLLTVLGAKNGFWQIPLDEKSIIILTCFNTPFGRYRCLSGLTLHPRSGNAQSINHDDLLIVGCGTTEEEADIDHNKNLRAFLDRA